MRPYEDEPLRESAGDLSESLSEDDDEDDERSLSGVSAVSSDGSAPMNHGWCQCLRCVIMPTVQECVCCQDYTEVQQKQPKGCITQHNYFGVLCLDTEVLSVALCEPLDTNASMSLEKQYKRFRFAAYRQFTRWIWGYLGPDNRKILPACAVTAIRRAFPSTSYIGFKSSNS
ncbi:P2X purinoceptor 7-like [Ornithodoros turicata]|uniref:P2X purinoceptor 7-like n=1 Tax=Ornithodoros turicata TaxID=34597 RepID=UPI003138882E